MREAAALGALEREAMAMRDAALRCCGTIDAWWSSRIATVVDDDGDHAVINGWRIVDAALDDGCCVWSRRLATRVVDLLVIGGHDAELAYGGADGASCRLRVRRTRDD